METPDFCMLHSYAARMHLRGRCFRCAVERLAPSVIPVERFAAARWRRDWQERANRAAERRARREQQFGPLPKEAK